MRSYIPALIKLIVFLVITAVATYVLAATISNQSYGAANSYTAEFTDASGLNLGDDVRIAGVRVGSVTNIKIEPKPAADSVAQVSFTVQKSRPLPRSVTAHLRYRNLVGQRYIDIEQGSGPSNGTMPDGGNIPTSRTFPAVDLTVLFQGFRPLVQGLNADEVNKLTFNTIQTLQGEGGGLEALFKNVSDLTNTLADKDKVIGELIDNLNGVLGALADHDSQLNQLIIQLRGFIEGLANDRTTIGNSLAGINDLATSTSGLLTQVRQPLAADIKKTDGFVNVFNKNKPVVNYVLRELPPTFGALIRTASYGSWFNFYLCQLNYTITGPNDAPDAQRSGLRNYSAQRCN